MSEGETYRLFNVIGIELEYCIVSKKDFSIQSFARKLFKILNNNKTSNTFTYNNICMSNEMVNHVIEFKPIKPYKDILFLEQDLLKCTQYVNSILEKYDLCIVPLSLHPTMKPQEATMWKGKYHSIYKIYDKLFGVKTHSFSNMQSLQITLPFENEQQMLKLHNSIRLVLPFLKILSASSPYLEGKNNKTLSNRINFFKKSHANLTERFSSPITDYLSNIGEYYKYLDMLLEAFSDFKIGKNVKTQWFNSQGSMIKFQFNAIEIRTCDIQESVHANLGLAHFIYQWVKYIYDNVENTKISFETLNKIFESKHSDMVDKEYLNVYGIDKEMNILEFLNYICDNVKLLPHYKDIIKLMIQKNLSTRMTEKYEEFSTDLLVDIYKANKSNMWLGYKRTDGI